MPRRAMTIFSEVRAEEERRNSLAFPEAVARPNPSLCAIILSPFPVYQKWDNHYDILYSRRIPHERMLEK